MQRANIRRTVIGVGALVALAGRPALSQTEIALAWLTAHEEDIVATSDRLWETAEPAHHETATSALLQEELARAGFTVQAGVADLPTAFVASYGSGEPTIGIVALLDALPGLSQRKGALTRRPIPAESAGHGCGHNLIAAADLGAALALRAAMAALPRSGTIRLYGAPAEEIYHGGVFMVRAGAFDDLDALLFWHPSSVTLAMGRSGLAMDSARFVFLGRPADATDAADAGENALSAALAMARDVDEHRDRWSASSVVNYVLPEGGLVPSVVPERSTLWVFAHGRDRAEVDAIRNDLVRFAEGAARRTSTRVVTERLSATREWLINETLASLLNRLLEEEAAPPYTEEERALAAALRTPFASDGSPEIFEGVLPLEFSNEPVPISDDTAEASWVVPRGGFLVASFPAGVPSHTWQWTASGASGIAHKGMMRAARVLTRAAIELLTNEDELAAVRSEFREATRGFRYASPIPRGTGPFDYLPPPDDAPR